MRRAKPGRGKLGDVSWSVPAVTPRFPSNIDGRTGHHWSSAMAAPIAHKGAVAGARVIAATMLDLLQQPQLRDEAWRYFREEQTATQTCQPFIGPDDPPAIKKNAAIMERCKDELSECFYDPGRYGTYHEQLGIDSPELRTARVRRAPQQSRNRSERTCRGRPGQETRAAGPA
mgnify:CR=1 FL=1